jgi:uncharacterized protein
MDFKTLLFCFYFLSFLGWIFELFLELAFRFRLEKNRGFLYGPYIPIYAVGIFTAYMVGNNFRPWPVLVFLCGSIFCTLVEFIAAAILERFFSANAWDYRLFPFGRWTICNGHISLIPSVFFGFCLLGIIYVFSDIFFSLMAKIHAVGLVISDIVITMIFIADITLSARKYLKNKSLGIMTKAPGMEETGSNNGKAQIDLSYFYEIAAPILEHEVFCKSKDFIQHGAVSIYEHSLSVAISSYKIACSLKIRDRASIIRSALLHDFFLYDWHDDWNLSHGFTHPAAAAKNARLYFNISDKEYACIRSHMWPFTLFHAPRSLAGWIICLADKSCSLTETIFGRVPIGPGGELTEQNRTEQNRTIAYATGYSLYRQGAKKQRFAAVNLCFSKKQRFTA